MRYNTIRQLDIANGKGIGISIFIQGCHFNCPGCFNTVAKDFDGGTEFTEQTMELLLELAKPYYIDHLSVLGGEPMNPQNREEVIKLIRKFKSVYPDKTVWLWTGYLIEDVFEDLVDSKIDVVVDGLFQEELKDARLKYKGSSNQRVIDFKETLRTGEIVLYE